MSLHTIAKHPRRVMLLALLLTLAGQAAYAGTLTLEGQNRGDTNNWYAGNRVLQKGYVKGAPPVGPS